MDFPIIPYKGDSPMKPWPPLAANAFCLQCGAGETIFYYDSAAGSSSSSTDSSAESTPVFILIHGLGDEADTWRHIIPLLNSRGFRVLAVDLPGFGRSVTQRKINFKTHTEAVLKLIEALVPEKQVFLAGSSMGAMVAEAAAFQRPDIVKGIALVDGSIPGGPSNPGLLALAKLLFSRKWYKAFRGNPEGAWKSLMPYYADLDSMSEGDKEFLRKRVVDRVESDTQEKAFFATQRSLIWTYLFSVSGFARKVKDYKGKIFLVWGQKDKIIPLSSAENFTTLRSDIKLEVIPGAGHLPHQEKPEEVARLLADWCQESF